MKKTCPICREQHEHDRRLHFDGRGVNACGMYRTRIATFTSGASDDTAKILGPMFAAAPQMLDALIGLAKRCNGYLQQNPYSVPEYKAALQAIDAARGVTTTGAGWMDALERAEKVGAA